MWNDDFDDFEDSNLKRAAGVAGSVARKLGGLLESAFSSVVENGPDWARTIQERNGAKRARLLAKRDQLLTKRGRK